MRDQIEQIYNRDKRIYELVATRVREKLYSYCESHGYAVSSRIKTLPSLLEKIETGRFSEWKDINDIVACTIVIPSYLAEDTVRDFLSKDFVKVSMIARGQHKKPPEVFRFDSTRVYLKLKPPIEVDTEDLSRIYDVVFEVQIKTAFEHAWSTATHDLAYKTQEIEWQRLRLAAQLKATVEQLDMLILAFDKNTEFIKVSPWDGLDNKIKLTKSIIKIQSDENFPEELKSKDVSRLVDGLMNFLYSHYQKVEIKRVKSTLENYFSSTRPDMIPRSVSFLNICIGEILKSAQPDLEGNFYASYSQSDLNIIPELNKLSKLFKIAE